MTRSLYALIVSVLLSPDRFSISTSSWWMAENEPGGAGVGVSYIELDRDRVSTEEMLAVEAACNDAIREATRVEVRTFEAGDPELDRVCKAQPDVLSTSKHMDLVIERRFS